MTGADAALDALPFGVVAMGADRVRANSAARAHGPALLRALAGSVRNRPNLIELNAATFEAQWTAYDGGWLVALADVSAHVERRERAEGAALTDPLTGLPNRAALAADLHGALERAAELASDAAVLMVDLDGFKPVNDTLGHAVGDALLRAVAGRLRGATRDGETVYRLGGDEFAILLPEPDGGAGGPIAAADALARRVVDLAGRSFLIEGQMVRIGASVGVAVSEGTVDADAILRRADIALYRAKEGGRSRHAHYEAGMDRALQERRELELDLRRALALEQFELHYQPQFDLHGATVTGFEALVRWQHPSRGMVSPADFIPVAEASGQIVPIGEWVLRAACAEAASWTAPLEVSVNASPVQFASGDFVDTVRRALDRSGLDARRLVIEITEGVLLAETGDTMATLTALRDLGVRIAMDDFGTGCSSLSYLRSFPFDIVKVDQSFVRGDGDRERREAIVRSVVALGREMGMAVTAEGVETMEQMEAIHRDGCGHAQGYLIGRPVPGSIARAMIEGIAAPAAERLRREANATVSGPETSNRPVEPAAPEPVAPRALTPAVPEPVEASVRKPTVPEPTLPATGSLYRLVYQSTCVLHETEAALIAEVEDILEVARANNARLGVTGALMFNGTHYAQVLEGERETVERLFETINLDPRHADVALLSFEPVAERMFGHWSMARVGTTEGRLAELAHLTGFDRDALAGDEMAARLLELLERDAAEAVAA